MQLPWNVSYVNNFVPVIYTGNPNELLKIVLFCLLNHSCGKTESTKKELSAYNLQGIVIPWTLKSNSAHRY